MRVAPASCGLGAVLPLARNSSKAAFTWVSIVFLFIEILAFTSFLVSKSPSILRANALISLGCGLSAMMPLLKAK